MAPLSISGATNSSPKTSRSHIRVEPSDVGTVLSRFSLFVTMLAAQVVEVGGGQSTVDISDCGGCGESSSPFVLDGWNVFCTPDASRWLIQFTGDRRTRTMISKCANPKCDLVFLYIHKGASFKLI